MLGRLFSLVMSSQKDLLNSLTPTPAAQTLALNSTVSPNTNFLKARNKHGKSVLHKAVESNNVPLIISLLESQDIDVNSVDNEGNTPLHLAAKKNDSKILKILLENQQHTVLVNQQNNLGDAPLHVALQAEQNNKIDFKATKKFGSHAKIDVNLISQGEEQALEPIDMSKNSNAGSKIELLIEYQADINLPNAKGETLFLLILKSNNIEMYSKKLLSHLYTKANIYLKTRENKSCLHFAAANASMSLGTFSFLVDKCMQDDKHCDELLNGLDTENYSPLYYTIVKNHYDKFLHLLTKKPVLFPNKKHSRLSPLHLALKKQNTKIAIQLIILDGKNPNPKERFIDAIDADKKSALNYAAETGDIEVINKLKQYKANFGGETGKAAVRSALINNHIAVLQVIIAAGAESNVHIDFPKNNKKWLSSIGSMSSISKINFTNTVLQPGDTPLHFAVRTNNKSLAEICLHRNQDIIRSVNEKEHRAAHLAIKYLHPQIANLLYINGEVINAETDCSKSKKHLTAGEEGSLMIKAASKGFASIEELYAFFTDPNYTLTENQQTIKDRMTNLSLKKHLSPVEILSTSTGVFSQTQPAVSDETQTNISLTSAQNLSQYL